nr:MAG TPA: hypothetical protein [Bacteriophage sp.]
MGFEAPFLLLAICSSDPATGWRRWRWWRWRWRLVGFIFSLLG